MFSFNSDQTVLIRIKFCHIRLKGSLRSRVGRNRFSAQMFAFASNKHSQIKTETSILFLWQGRHERAMSEHRRPHKKFKKNNRHNDQQRHRPFPQHNTATAWWTSLSSHRCIVWVFNTTWKSLSHHFNYFLAAACPPLHPTTPDPNAAALRLTPPPHDGHPCHHTTAYVKSKGDNHYFESLIQHGS